MSRTVALSPAQGDEQGNDTSAIDLETLDGLVEVGNDDATLSQSLPTSLSSTQYVVYSVTFQVPAFYFTIHNTRAWAYATRHTCSEDQFQMDHPSV